MRMTIKRFGFGLGLWGACAAAAADAGPASRPADPRYAVQTVDAPADFTGRFASKADWEDRASILRRQVLVANGLWPMPVKGPLNAVVHGKIERDAYTIEKVYFTSLPGHYVSGNLYRPKAAGKHPVVLCPHGHWTNGRFVWNDDAAMKKELASGAERDEPGARSVLQARCAMLARMGCVVFHYDMVGYADSDRLVHRQGFTDVESVLRLQSQMGLQTWNGIRAIDFVSTLADVDTTRIGVTGASGGGTQTFVLAAVDPRVTAAFPAVMVGTAMQGGCVCENAALLRVGTNNAEIAALFAPRPMAMSAANDWTKDLLTRGLPEMKRVWGLYDAADRVTARHFPLPHNYAVASREMMYGWFNRHLKLGLAEPIVEQPFVPVPVKELSVWDAEHPRPADAANAATLRKTMTEMSDRQMADLAGDRLAYKAVLKPALEAMIVDRYPGPAGVRVARHGGPVRDGTVTVERGEVERAADGTRVPYVAMFPDGWAGKVVVLATEHGIADVVGADGKRSDVAAAAIEAKTAVVATDLFWTASARSAGSPADVRPPAAPDYATTVNPPYAAFNLGYNRSTLGNRVHDLLSVVAMARGWEETKSVRLLGVGKAGPWALLAKAAAGDVVDKLAADLGGFDFNCVMSEGNPNLLPGARKYGGIYGLIPVCDSGETLLASTQVNERLKAAGETPGVTISDRGMKPMQMLEWLK